MTHREDLGFVSGAASERIVRGSRAIFFQPQDLATQTSGLLSGIAVRCASGHVQHAIASPSQARARSAVAGPRIADDDVFYFDKLVSLKFSTSQRGCD